MDDIDAIRQRIDELDSRLVELLNQRAECAHKIGHLKSGQHLPIYEPRREQVIFENVRRHNRGPLDDNHIVRIYERIIDIMREIQRLEIDPGPRPDRSPDIEEND